MCFQNCLFDVVYYSLMGRSPWGLAGQIADGTEADIPRPSLLSNGAGTGGGKRSYSENLRLESSEIYTVLTLKHS
jgi:hypothetical protein